MNEDALCPGLGDYLMAQARNNHWSNHRLHSACLRLPSPEYYANRPSFFGSIHIHLDHIVFVDWLYLERLTGEQYLPADVGDELHKELAPLVEDQATADRALIEYCAAATPETLSSVVSFRLLDGTQYTEPVGSVLAHLFTHQIHHRGQVHDMLSATSVAPPQLDEFFLNSDLSLRESELKALNLPIE
ncbi:MAG: damage-inducible protein DinB [Acidiferrobacteraceae bacterium]|nr:damage-inducible protein DinB [Acidiferrobacteraceae bacterium]